MSSLKEISDSDLVIKYLEGDVTAMARLVKKWHKIFCNCAYRYVNDVDLAKDIAQDSWVSIINSISNLIDPEKFGSWALSIVTRNCLGLISKKDVFNHLKDCQLEDRLFVNQVEQIDKVKIREAIKKLSVKQQIVLRLFYVEGYRIQEIALELNISVGTVKSRLFVAREKLKLIIK